MFKLHDIRRMATAACFIFKLCGFCVATVAWLSCVVFLHGNSSIIKLCGIVFMATAAYSSCVALFCIATVPHLHFQTSWKCESTGSFLTPTWHVNFHGFIVGNIRVLKIQITPKLIGH